MAGSIKWFEYTDDAGVVYAIKLDESNTEAVNGEQGDYTTTSTTTAGVPRNIKPREVFYSNVERTRTIRCVPLSQSTYADIITGQAAQTIPDPTGLGAGNLGLIRANGERRILPTPLDTGIQDGDDT